MKLETSIAPRADGTVIVHGKDGKDVVFTPDAAGFLVADVDHEETIAHLLTLDTFIPADAADHERAAQLVGKNFAQSAEEEEQGGDGSGDGGEDGDGAEDAGAGGLPIEAKTPPVAKAPAKKPAAKKAPAKRAK